ncbi:hypothetical protein FB446DRAFT_675419 [Lentinula raphanica]|nr:hypothetical protein FB446DRAFT_675419 [Lentinula raphanica]
MCAESGSSPKVEDPQPSQRSSRDTPARSAANVVEFEMPRALKRPRDTTYSVRSLYEDMKRGFIDVEPEYQRDVVWKADKQMMLIDTIFTNHYMPPLIFSVIYDENDNESRKVCLDGKQRLTSIQLLLALQVHYSETLKSWWFKANETSSSKNTKYLLPEHIRQSFINKQIKCTEYDELDEDGEREIFRRVQLGVALSSAEKLRVLHTRRSKFINELKESYVTKEGLAAPSFRWERTRGADFRCLAQSVFVMWKWDKDGEQSIKSAGTLSQVERWLEENDEAIPDEFSSAVKGTFATLVQLTSHQEYSAPFSMYTKVSPVEIIGVIVLIYAHSTILPTDEKLTPAELSAAFTQLRREVRREHKDIRLNDRVGKTIINFVKAYQKSASHALSIAELTNPAPVTVDTTPSSSSNTPSRTPRKRKRDVANIDEHAAKRSTTENPALSTPIGSNALANTYLLTFSPSGEPTTTFGPAPQYTPLMSLSAPQQQQQIFQALTGQPGFRYPGPFLSSYAPHAHATSAQFQLPPSTPIMATPTPSTSSTILSSSPSSSATSNADAVGTLRYSPDLKYLDDSHGSGPALSMDTMGQLHGETSKNTHVQQAPVDRQPTTQAGSEVNLQSQSMAPESMTAGSK